MRRGGDTFPGAGTGRRSAVGRAGRAALDQDLDSILGGNDDDILGSSSPKQTNTRGRSTTSAHGKKSSLTSGATDEDFYSSLAQMAGDSLDDDDDPDESLSEADAKKMADSLADLDDMESDLFGGSLGKKTTPKKPTKSAKTASEPKKINTDNEPTPSVDSTGAKSSSPSSAKSSEKKDTKQDTGAVATKPKETQKPRKKFDFGEFDEDDPLAGLLSDEDDNPKPKSKPKKSATAKKAGSSRISNQDSIEQRPKSSRGRRAANPEPANSTSPPVTPEHQPAVKRDKAESGTVSSPPGSPAATPDSTREDERSSQASPPDKGIGKTAARKAKPSKDEINFDSDDDLPGLNDSIEKTPRDSPTPPPRSKPERSNRQKKEEPSADIFGDDEDDDGLPGTETESDSPSRNSRFSELLGKKEKDEPKKQVPKSLDDFMANISGKSPAGNTASKKVSSPTSEESFQFGGYMPSAASSSQSRSRGGLARPDTAPSSTKRSVRFSDDLGLGDELFGSERPSTAPGKRQAKRGDKDENINGSYLDDNKKPLEGNKPIRRETTSSAAEEVKDEPVKNPQAVKLQDDTPPAVQGSKPSGVGGGGDWLGLGGGDQDGGLDLNNVPLKTSTPFPRESKKDSPSTQSPPERQERQASPPRRAGRRRGDGDNDEFLRMLGITPDEPLKPSQVKSADESGKSSFPWESPGGSPRRGRRWRDQASPQSSLDTPDPPSSPGGSLERPQQTTGQEGPLDRHQLAAGQGGPLDSSQQAAVQGGPLDNEGIRPRGMQDKRQASVNQDTPRPTSQQQLVNRSPVQGQPGSQLYPAQASAVPPASTPSVEQHVPPPQSIPLQPDPSHPQLYPSQQPYASGLISPRGNIPPQMGAQPYTHQSYPQYQSPPFATSTSQNVPQTLPYQPQYQSPAGFQSSPQIPQPSSLERLEMTKLKAESELQQSRLMEYEVASEHREQQKTRLEEEVKELMKKVQEMEGVRQKKDLDATSKVSELEGKIRRLELEREQLLSTIEALKTRHKDELANIDSSHKSHLKTLEDSYQRREQRLKDETDLIIQQNSEKLRILETEKADLQTSYSRKLSVLETAKNNEIETLKDLHRRALEQFRAEHEEEVAHLRRLKEQEVSAATSAHAHSKSLQSLMDQVLNSTREVSDLRQKIEVTHRTGLEERELSARARDEYLKQLQERLHRQQSENDEERTRLQGLVSKMELHMREQTRQVDQERWRLSQEESRIKALQAALEDERRITMEQLSSQRAEVQRARDDLVREQRATMGQIQEERRSLATERAQLSSAHRDLISREKLKTESSVQAEADLGATAVKIKEDAAALSVREAQLKQEEERLRREKLEFERQRSGFEEERDRIGKLGLEVQKRSREIDELCSDAGRVRDEGEQALELAERVRANAEAQRAEAEGMFLVAQEKERQLAQDRLAVAHERRLLEKDKQTGRCWQCEGRRTSPTEHIHTTDSPAVDMSILTQPSLPMSAPGTPDLLVNSLELKRTLRKWSHDKEKDEEFLEQEAQFLNRLQRSRDTSNYKPNSSLNSAVY